MRGFLGGLVVGAAAGAGAFLALDPGDSGSRAPSGRAPANAAARADVEAALRAEIAELRARLDEGRPDAAAAGPPAPPESTAPENPAEAARREAYARVREQLQEVRDAEPGSPRVRALVEAWRAAAKGDAADEAEIAGRALLRLAAWEKLRPEDIEALAEDFGRLAPGAPGRPGLAAAVARGWARDPRLAQWFDGLPPVEEPAIRAAVVEALDESPSDAYREWLIHVSRTEPEAEVLAEAWQEDPVTVALTPEMAPRLIAAIEPRAAQGDLPAVVRGRALMALGLAGAYDAPAARAAIERLVAREPDEGVRDFGRAVIGAIDRQEANVQVFDGLWSRHRRTFGE